MFIVYDEDELESVVEAFAVAPGKPVLLDKFLEEAIELDVDCISDGETTVVGGMLQHLDLPECIVGMPPWFFLRTICLRR